MEDENRHESPKGLILSREAYRVSPTISSVLRGRYINRLRGAGKVFGGVGLTFVGSALGFPAAVDFGIDAVVNGVEIVQGTSGIRINSENIFLGIAGFSVTAFGVLLAMSGLEETISGKKHAIMPVFPYKK